MGTTPRKKQSAGENRDEAIPLEPATALQFFLVGRVTATDGSTTAWSSMNSDSSDSSTARLMFEKACSKVLPSLWFVIPVAYDGAGAHDWRYGGTAFAVNSNGLLFTAAHVTYTNMAQRTQADSLYVIRPDDVPNRRFCLDDCLSARVIARDDVADTAVLEIEALRAPVPHVRLSTDAPDVGSPCATMGFSAAGGTPEAGFTVYARAAYGMVSTKPYPFSDNGGQLREIQEADMIVHEGGSGGPVFLRSGVVFGAIRGSLAPAVGQQGRVENLTGIAGVSRFTEIVRGQIGGLEFVHHGWRWGLSGKRPA